MHKEMSDLLEFRRVCELQDVVAAVVKVFPVLSTVQSAVLPATVPESATDFFGLKVGTIGVVSVMKHCGEWKIVRRVPEGYCFDLAKSSSSLFSQL